MESKKKEELIRLLETVGLTEDEAKNFADMWFRN